MVAVIGALLFLILAQFGMIFALVNRLIAQAGVAKMNLLPQPKHEDAPETPKRRPVFSVPIVG